MQRVESLFKDYKIMRNADQSELAILVAVRRNHECRIILYGAGNIGHLAIKYLKDSDNVLPDYIIDEAPICADIEGIPVISLKDFAIEEDKRYCVIIAVKSYSSRDAVKFKILKNLSCYNVEKIIDIFPIIAKRLKCDWCGGILQNKDKFINAIDIYRDKLSKETYVEYLRAHLEGDFFRGKTFAENEKYFDMGIYQDRIDECWINFGSAYGDTIFYYLNKYWERGFEKIYAVEINQQSVSKLKENFLFLPDNMREKIAIINTFFGGKSTETKVDDFFSEKKVTLINMDIEGAEENVLKSAEYIIKRNRPVIAVCVYHRWNDLIVIPSLIRGMVEQYTFFLRKHATSPGDYYNGRYYLNELVLYAVPNERLVIE